MSCAVREALAPAVRARFQHPSWKYINQAEALRQAAEETDQENPPFSGLDSFVPVMSARQAEWLHGTG